MHDSASSPRPIAWYRTLLDKKNFKSLHERSDWLGGLQSLGYLGLLAATGLTALYGAGHWPVGVTLLLVLLYGTFLAFVPNAVHELGHGTVFKTKFLNGFFVRIFGFLGWNNFEKFNVSHARHHRYTLHVPDDLEVVLPTHILVRHFFQEGFVHPVGLYNTLRDTVGAAFGKFRGPWELALFPEGSPEKKAPIRWARTLLAGHGLIIVISLYFHLWMVPVLTVIAPFCGSWLFFLCNNTQHIGLQDNVSDFRLCCRTFTMNPFVEFLYWHMNYHTEHHMYAAVPCYKLKRLHEAIKHDLPPCPHGLIATWKEIAEIQSKQHLDPTYQYSPCLPATTTQVS